MIEEKVSSEERGELSEADDLERTVFEQLLWSGGDSAGNN